MNKKMKVVAITNDHKVEVKEVRRPDVKPGKNTDAYQSMCIMYLGTACVYTGVQNAAAVCWRT